MKSRLPKNIKLQRNPREYVWYYYKTLSCITYLENNEIRTLLKIPLLSTKKMLEVFKIYNLFILLEHKQSKFNFMVKYKIETEMLMMSSKRTKYSLLTESSYQLCSSRHL